MSIPETPGLYWASCAIVGEYDSIVRVYGKAPFLKWDVISLHVNRRGKKVVLNLREDPAIGPRLDIPSFMI
jgi:hypothetical protein